MQCITGNSVIITDTRRIVRYFILWSLPSCQQIVAIVILIFTTDSIIIIKAVVVVVVVVVIVNVVYLFIVSQLF